MWLGPLGDIPQWAGARSASSCWVAEGPLSGLLRALWYPRLLLPAWDGAGGFLTCPLAVCSHIPSKSLALEVPKLALACHPFLQVRDGRRESGVMWDMRVCTHLHTWGTSTTVYATPHADNSGGPEWPLLLSGRGDGGWAGEDGLLPEAPAASTEPGLCPCRYAAPGCPPDCQRTALLHLVTGSGQNTQASPDSDFTGAIVSLHPLVR